MKKGDNPNWFANSPLVRPNIEKDQHAFVDARINDPDSLLLPMFRGDPLITDGNPAYLSVAARKEFPADAPVALLGVRDERAVFAIDASGAAQDAGAAPFAEIGEYQQLRGAASAMTKDDLAIVGHAHWLFEWRRRHRFCSNCGSEVAFGPAGAKAHCANCDAEHFPRTNPVAIVLAIHDDACLLGRGPAWPPGFVSALAGFVEAGETPEECARREIFEEAGVVIDDVRYQFSQPWPFTSSLMMGFLASAQSREINLDTDELAEAHWYKRSDVIAALNGAAKDFYVPPEFTIARQLLERWVKE